MKKFSLLMGMLLLVGCSRSSSDTLVVDPIRGSLGIFLKVDFSVVREWVKVNGGDSEFQFEIYVQEKDGGGGYSHHEWIRKNAEQMLNSTGVLEFRDLVENLPSGDYEIYVDAIPVSWDNGEKFDFFPFAGVPFEAVVTIVDGEIEVFEFGMNAEGRK